MEVSPQHQKAVSGRETKLGADMEKTVSPSDGIMTTWTEAEEKAVRWKLDFYLMPILIFGFFALQLDRSNISNALTGTLKEDVHLTSAQVNVGSQLMSAGIVIAEIPSNLLLQHVGAARWITFILSIWGAISLGQAYVTNVHSFYATRFLLGLFEGGYIPGSQYILATFYRNEELAMRTAIFYFGNYFSAATGSLMAAGILTLDGRRGLAGWQWIFLIEGAITLFAFIVFFLLMPSSPASTRPIHGRFDFFSDRERQVMQARVVVQDQTRAATRASLTWRSLLEAACDVRLWLHMALNVAALAPKGGLQLYGPTIIKSLGFNTTKANLLNSVSSYLVVVLSFSVSLASDRMRLRGPWCIVTFLWSIAFAGALLGVGASSDKWLRYALFVLLSGGNALAQGLNDAWVSINARSPAKRSIGLAAVVIGSNLGGIIGPSLFRDSDKPAYRHAFSGILGLYSASIALTLAIMAVYLYDNRRLASRPDEREEDGSTSRLRKDI